MYPEDEGDRFLVNAGNNPSAYIALHPNKNKLIQKFKQPHIEPSHFNNQI
jgi:hypothetical protein